MKGKKLTELEQAKKDVKDLEAELIDAIKEKNYCYDLYDNLLKREGYSKGEIYLALASNGEHTINKIFSDEWEAYHFADIDYEDAHGYLSKAKNRLKKLENKEEI